MRFQNIYQIQRISRAFYNKHQITEPCSWSYINNIHLVCHNINNTIILATFKSKTLGIFRFSGISALHSTERTAINQNSLAHWNVRNFSLICSGWWGWPHLPWVKLSEALGTGFKWHRWTLWMFSVHLMVILCFWFKVRPPCLNFQDNTISKGSSWLQVYIQFKPQTVLNFTLS